MARDFSNPPAARAAADLQYAWRVLSVTGLGMTVAFMNVSMVPVALPDMVGDLRAGPVQSDWFLLAYQLVTAILMMPMARVSDIAGRRTMYVGGLALICLSSCAITLAPDPSVVIGFRALQGLGAAAVIVNTTALLADAFPPSMVAVGIGYNVTIMSAAIAVGPVFGGWLTVTFGWRGVFALTVPLALVGSSWAAHTLRRGWQVDTSLLRHFDLAGTIAVGIGLGGLVLAVSMSGPRGWGDAVVLVAAAATILGGLAFWVIERRASAPILDFALFRSRYRAHAYGSTALLTLGQTSIAIIVSLYLQSAAGFSALDAGLYLTAQAAGNVATASIAGRLAARVQTRVLATAGTLGVLGSMLAMAAMFSTGYLGWGIALGLFAFGFASGFFVTPNAAAINVGVEPHQRGMANGFRVAIDNSGMMLSSALALLLVTLSVPAAVKPDAIGGRIEELTAGQRADFLDAFPTALLLLSIFVVLAGLVSASRGRDPEMTSGVAAVTDATAGAATVSSGALEKKGP